MLPGPPREKRCANDARAAFFYTLYLLSRSILLIYKDINVGNISARLGSHLAYLLPYQSTRRDGVNVTERRRRHGRQDKPPGKTEDESAR